MITRYPAVSGAFYPAQSNELMQQVLYFLRSAQPCEELPEPPKMLIVPHAGYVYSGQIAANAYVHLNAWQEQIHRVVLMGPSHRVPLNGIAVTDADQFLTPLGDVQVDVDAAEQIVSLAAVNQMTEAHREEHSLEVQLPFLQVLLDDFKLIPLVVGRCSDADVVAVLDQLWQPQTLIVVSTDLSHYLYDDDARRVDEQTVHAILKQASDLRGEQACGHYPLNGALHFARQHGWRMREVSRGNSGDISGDKERVVGYASFASYEKAA